MQSLLSVSETNAFQSFLSIMDYSEDSLTNSEWALLQAPPPNPDHFYVDQHDQRDSLSRATKDLITLQPDRWRAQQPPQTVYDSYPRHVPQERMHDPNIHPHYNSNISRQHQHHHQQQPMQHYHPHQHQRNSVSSSSSASYPYPPKAYHSMQPPMHHHSHSHHQHHSPSPGPTPTSASSQHGFPPPPLPLPQPIQRPMSSISMHDPSSADSLLAAPLRGISPSHSHSHSHSPMVPTSSLRHALQRSPSEVPLPLSSSNTSRHQHQQHPHQHQHPHAHPAHLTSSASLSSRRTRTSSTPPIPMGPVSGAGAAGPSSISASSSTTTTTATAPPAPKQALLSPSQKKANHIQSEQKRRANIRRGYEALCETVPALREAIRAEEAEAAVLAERGAAGGGGGGRRRRKKAAGKEEKDRIDGRAGPRSENVVLMKTIEHIQTLLSDTQSLKTRLQNARAMLPAGHPALVPSTQTHSSQTHSGGELEQPLWEREWKGGQGRMGTRGPGEDEESEGDEEV
ncbi:hypothetical protein CPB83DRAFT_413766 [Crepidotus variabilis]|uniref:BHLH domain-containing protein n=1 Tax=Crepidotus variabilis TaxID=179855 RepID=A0A9P6ES65_9AGAR|nr:hypothetical protein CPB83DRAFT_413766 [Crepidotus variabilis]